MLWVSIMSSWVGGRPVGETRPGVQLEDRQVLLVKGPGQVTPESSVEQSAQWILEAARRGVQAGFLRLESR